MINPIPQLTQPLHPQGYIFFRIIPPMGGGGVIWEKTEKRQFLKFFFTQKFIDFPLKII